MISVVSERPGLRWIWPVADAHAIRAIAGLYKLELPVNLLLCIKANRTREFMQTRLDHIVIAARTLDEGANYVRRLLGVEIPDGGRHEIMGTHNRVMSLGAGVYLEVIAVNPEMRPPAYPRWFGLDDPHIQQTLHRGPALLTWAVNTDDLDSLVRNSAVSLGEVKPAQRDNLRWKAALTEDGRMPGAGFVPLCIQWQVDFHPSQFMHNPGCSINSLTLYHAKYHWLANALESIGANNLVTIKPLAENKPAYMELDLTCPRGNVLISSKH